MFGGSLAVRQVVGAAAKTPRDVFFLFRKEGSLNFKSRRPLRTEGLEPRMMLAGVQHRHSQPTGLADNTVVENRQGGHGHSGQLGIGEGHLVVDRADCGWQCSESWPLGTGCRLAYR